MAVPLAGADRWGRHERDPQRFWLTVPGQLCQTSAGSALVGAITAASDLHAWTIVEWLVKQMAPPQGRLWLVNNDMPELDLTGA
jgi:hypothetical protein